MPEPDFDVLYAQALPAMRAYLEACQTKLEDDLNNGVNPEVAAKENKARIERLTCEAECQQSYCLCMKTATTPEAKGACLATLRRCLNTCP